MVIVIGSGSDDLADKSSHRLVTSADHHMRELDKDLTWIFCGYCVAFLCMCRKLSFSTGQSDCVQVFFCEICSYRIFYTQLSHSKIMSIVTALSRKTVTSDT